MTKYHEFVSLPTKTKKRIVMVFRAYLLVNNISWKRIANTPAVQPSTPKYGLPEVAVLEFMKICDKKGLKLSKVEATKEAHNLINLYKILI